MLRLEQLNPAVKAATIVVCVLVLALFYDPWTPLLFLAWTWGTGMLFGRIHWKKWVLFFPPFLLFAFGYFWTVALFAGASETSSVWWEWGGIRITQEGLDKGLSLGLRVLAFASISFIFVFTTDPVHFIYSLMRQCKLPPKLAYGILAGFRFMPSLREEFAIMKKAHMIRGVDRAKGWRERAKRLGRYVIPLLAAAIRKAERTAMAMESKGFTGDRNRTYYYDMKVTGRDGMYVAWMLVGLIISVTVSWKLGTLTLYRIQL